MRTSARAWVAGLLWLALQSSVSGCAKPQPAAGLRPLPLRMIGWTRDARAQEVDSLRPTLRWETFPRPEDLKVDIGGHLVNARGVTYEIRIWSADDWYPVELVYARAGLSEPVHTLETPLAPDTLYLWTIRARFDLDGQQRVTEWAFLGFNDDRVPVLPPSGRYAGYYGLKTPKQ